MAPIQRDKCLFLHIGHGKTGSSFLQTCFASSIDELEAAQIVYPVDAVPLERARNGQTTEGNFPPISLGRGHSIDEFKRIVEGCQESGAKRILLSNEGLFQSIVLHDFLDSISGVLPDHEIKILLFIRDPFEHLISAYQELLKADLVEDIEGLFKVSSVPRNVGMALDKAMAVGADVMVCNFDRHRTDLKSVAEEWLGLKADTLHAGPRQSVNRSMDRSEILVQRAFNKYVGRHARLFVADVLASELPDLKPAKPFIDHDILEGFLNRMHLDVPIINSRIPKEEHYRVPSLGQARAMLPNREASQTIQLSLDQLDVLARNISKFLPPAWRKGDL